MATRKHPRPDLSEDDRQERQAEVYRLHCRGLTHRAIAAELGLDPSQVCRALTQAKAAIRKQKGQAHLANLADRLTEGAWEDLAQSWEEGELAAESLYVDKNGDSHTIRDHKAIAMERATRAKIRESIAKFNGLDPHKVAELELKRQELELKKRSAEAQERGVAAAEGLLAAWGAWDCGEPSDPDA